jgi:hypothetical protein
MPSDERGDKRRGIDGSPLHAFRDSPPPSTDVGIDFGAESRRGPRRSANEDHYLVVRLGRNQNAADEPSRASVLERFDEYAYGMLVADGLGGTGTGEVASRMAITTLVHLVIYFGRWNVRIDDDIAREVMDRAERFYRGSIQHWCTEVPRVTDCRRRSRRPSARATICSSCTSGIRASICSATARSSG